MVTVFFRQNGQTKSLEISPLTHERLRDYCTQKKIKFVDAVHEIRGKNGDLSEELIVLYLDYIASLR